MATYEEIYGKRVDVLDSDPTLSSAYEGQVWYNSTSGTLKTLVSFGAWFASTPQIVGGYSQGAAGTESALISVGRDKYPGPPPSSRTSGDAEEYNGSGWTSATSNPNAWAFRATCGTATAAITACGTLNGVTYQSGSELWNGSSWTSNTALPTISEAFNQFGTQTASIGFGGGTPSGYPSNAFTGDGEGWTAGPNLSNDKRYGSGCTGTSTAGIAFGGQAPTNAVVEELDGTTWTSGTAMPTTGHNMPTGVGTQSSAFALPGVMPSTTSTFKYDGTTWTADASTATPRSGRLSSGGTQTSCVLAGTPSNGTATEEYTFGINTTTAAAWAASNNMNTGSYNPSGLVGGTQSAVIAAGGDTGGPAYSTTKSEKYDGTSWTSAPTLNTARAAAVGTGTSTACIVFGAYPPSNGSATESWNGSSWTTSPATLGGPVERPGGAGTQTAALAFAYYNRPGNSNPTTVYTYNGSAWTSSPASMNTGRYGGSGLGTQTAAIAIGGITVSPPAQSAVVEQWDGSSWTSKTSVSTARGYAGASGTSTSAIFFGGSPPSATAVTEGWDGTSWSSRPSLGTARGGIGGSGTSADAGVGYGGGSYLANTEEFTGATETATAKTLTTS